MAYSDYLMQFIDISKTKRYICRWNVTCYVEDVYKYMNSITGVQEK